MSKKLISRLNKKTTSLLAFVIGFSILSGIIGEKVLANAETYNINAPHISENGIVTWDCVWFGSYPQAEIIESKASYKSVNNNYMGEDDLIEDYELYKKLESATEWDLDGDIVIDGKQYKRIKNTESSDDEDEDNSYEYIWQGTGQYHYFMYQPIKWRILSIDNDEIFLLSDKTLDEKKYEEKYNFSEVNWRVSTCRSFLNIDFYNAAFTSDEQKVVINKEITNKGNLQKQSTDGIDTVDKVFLLSESEVYGTSDSQFYGFNLDKNVKDHSRRSKSSTYSKAMGTEWNEELTNYWFLRSPGEYEYCASSLSDEGNYYNFYYGSSYGGQYSSGIRPAVRIQESSVGVYTYAGTVCSDGTMEEIAGGRTEAKKVENNSNLIFSISNPYIVEDDSFLSGQRVLWDCIWLGSYPQAEIVKSLKTYKPINNGYEEGSSYVLDGDLIENENLYDILMSAEGWDENDNIEINKIKYKRKRNSEEDSYHFFIYQPINL